MKQLIKKACQFNMATKLTGTTTKHQRYTVSNKLTIIQFVEQTGNLAAECEFGVSEGNVRLWQKSKENLEKIPRLKRPGKKAAWPELEIDLLAWFTEKRNNCLAILPSLVCLKALDLAKDKKYNITEGYFRAGNHWCLCFMKRNGLSLPQKTTLAQHLPDDYKEKIVRFHQFIIGCHKEPATRCTLSLTWMKLHSCLTFHQTVRSTIQERNRSKSPPQETRRISSQPCWHVVEMAPK